MEECIANREFWKHAALVLYGFGSCLCYAMVRLAEDLSRMKKGGIPPKVLESEMPWLVLGVSVFWPITILAVLLIPSPKKRGG